MSIQELIELAKESTIEWRDTHEAEELIQNLYQDGYTEAEIEKILYFMDNGQTADSAMQSLDMN